MRPVSVATALSAFLVAGYAIAGITAMSGHGALLGVAALVERDNRLSGDTVSRVAADAERVVDVGECRDDIVIAAMTVAMEDLRRQDPVDGFDDWSAALARADRVVRHGVACMPSDGRAWARLARIAQAMGEPRERIVALLARSQRFSPAEYAAIRDRIRIVDRAGGGLLGAAGEIVTRDVDALLLHGEPRHMVSVLRSADPPLRDLVQERLAEIPADRLEAVRLAKLEWLRLPDPPAP